MKKTTLEKYLEVYKQIKTLEEKKDEIADTLMDELDDVGVMSQPTPDGGLLSIHSRTTFEYSQNIQKMTAEVSKQKKLEELNGDATIKSITRHLSFKPLNTNPGRLS